MKILTFALILLSYINVFGQEVDVDINDVENETIHIIKGKQAYSFGSASQLQKAFGKAKVKQERDEVLGGYAYFYSYKGFETYYNEKDRESTTITSPEYLVFLDRTAYKIGDHISRLKDRFPLSYKNRNLYDSSAISIIISHKGSYTDAGIGFTYNEKGYITEISIANDNS